MELPINPWAVLRNYGWILNQNCSINHLEEVVYVSGLHRLGKKLGLTWSVLADEVYWKGWSWKEWTDKRE